MAYRLDYGMEFLRNVPSRDLNDLVYCLTHDKDGDPRLTEELTSTSAYECYCPNHQRYWKEIAAEIQCFGANSFMTMFRGGEGVLYREVLEDVCDKLNVSYSKSQNLATIEENLLLKILRQALGEMSSQQKKELLDSLGVDGVQNLNTSTLMIVFQAMIVAGGFKSYQLILIISNGVVKYFMGSGLSLATNAALTKGMSVLAGPIGWGISALWMLMDLSDPAYRVTIPAVVHVALLRRKQQVGA